LKPAAAQCERRGLRCSNTEAELSPHLAWTTPGTSHNSAKLHLATPVSTRWRAKSTLAWQCCTNTCQQFHYQLEQLIIPMYERCACGLMMLNLALHKHPSDTEEEGTSERGLPAGMPHVPGLVPTTACKRLSRHNHLKYKISLVDVISAGTARTRAHLGQGVP
jgi:hypothetical protein